MHMKILVTYKSKTDFTKKYAEIIASELNCLAIDFKNVNAETMSDYDVIVHGGGLHAGMVNGLKQAKEMFYKSSAQTFVAFATGGTPNTEADAIGEVWKNNLTSEELETIPHFYMQSGICYEKMSLPDKALMKMAAAMLSKKKDKNDFDEGFEQAIKQSYDISSEEYAKPLIKYIQERRSHE